MGSKSPVRQPRRPALALLADALAFGKLPSLGALGEIFDAALYYGEFLKLVNQFLPEKHQEIIRASRYEWNQCQAFCELFSQRYFPIHESETYGDLVYACSVHTEGIGYDQHHETGDIRLGLRLMWAVTTHPFPEDDEQEGIRVVLLEDLATAVPGIQAVLERLPKEGFAPEMLAALFKNTRFESFAHTAAWWHGATGNQFLDSAESDGDGDSNSLDWAELAKDSVLEKATSEWREAQHVLEGLYEMASWLEENPLERFAEAVAFILGRVERAERLAEAEAGAGGGVLDLESAQNLAEHIAEQERARAAGQLPLALVFAQE